MADIAIRVSNLSKLYRIGARQQRHDTLRDSIAALFDAPKRWFSRNGQAEREDTIWALKDVSFDVKHGEVVGIIGRNGAGKSTLLKILSRITKPTEGSVEIHGRVGSLLEVGTGFHPELTGRENIYLNGAILGMKRAEIERKFDEIVAFAEIEKFLDTPVKRYSSGMYVRLAFAVAAHLEPEILIVDEVLAVGDAQFQKKCLGKMGDVAKEGRTVLFVSHNMDAVRNLCMRALLLRTGKLELLGETNDVVRHFMGFDRTSATMDLYLSSRCIQIDKIKIVNSAGQLAESLRWDEEFAIHVYYQVLEELDGLAIGIMLINEDGIPVLHTSSRSALNTPELSKGKGISRVVIPRHLLSPGVYSVFLNAHTPYEGLCSTYNAISFRVVDTGREVVGKVGTMRWPGVVSPVLEWINTGVAQQT